jgi:hypothetical protein
MKNLKADDTEEISDEELVVTDKKKKGRRVSTAICFEEQENIEFILLDLKNFDELGKFKNMKSLSLMTQNIKSIEVRESFLRLRLLLNVSI